MISALLYIVKMHVIFLHTVYILKTLDSVANDEA